MTDEEVQPLETPEETPAPLSTEEALEEPLLNRDESTSSIHRISIDNNTSDSSDEERLVAMDHRPLPLAWASTTPLLAKLLLPLLILGTHALFWYGQTRPMWKLKERFHVDAWANATGHEARIAFDSLKLPNDNHILFEKDKDVRTFTYFYAIQELWRAKHMPGKFLPRVAAVLLILFSGVWPHLKLLLLLLTWFLARRVKRRSRILASLSILGKWSLCDVLVVCVMVGVLHLEWDIDPHAIHEGVGDNLPVIVNLVHTLYSATDLCTKALKYDCVAPKKLIHQMQCKACRSTVNTFFDHPDSAKPIVNGISTSGGGRGELFVAGMRGIYAFCAAVMLSILLSLIVDWYDYRGARVQEQQQRRGRTATEEEDNLAPEVSGTLSQHEGESFSESPLVRTHGTRLLVPEGTSRYSEADRHIDQMAIASLYKNRPLEIVSYVTAFFILAATTFITLERRVNGFLPQLLHDILGVKWTRPYSFLQMVRTTGLAGGWDFLLMGTFALFIIIGPLLRSLLCVHSVRKGRSTAGMILASIDFIGAFCAWEVFVAAVIMVDLLMPAITSTIIVDKRCAQLSNNSTCLEVEFDMRKTFSFVIMGGLLLVLVSWRIRSDHVRPRR